MRHSYLMVSQSDNRLQVISDDTPKAFIDELVSALVCTNAYPLTYRSSRLSLCCGSAAISPAQVHNTSPGSGYSWVASAALAEVFTLLRRRLMHEPTFG
jgi:hypothetical protein